MDQDTQSGGSAELADPEVSGERSDLDPDASETFVRVVSTRGKKLGRPREDEARRNRLHLMLSDAELSDLQIVADYWQMPAATVAWAFVADGIEGGNADMRRWGREVGAVMCLARTVLSVEGGLEALRAIVAEGEAREAA